jgi:serine/threonine protein kinase
MIDCYRILRTIGKGGFSVVYLAEDEESGDEVVVKEFMPKRLARRDARDQVVAVDQKRMEGLERSRRLFFQEVKAMAMLRHPNIVGVLGLYLRNQTAYLIMQHERGRNLAQFVSQRGGGISTTLLLRIFVPLLDALALIHRHSMLHLDVKPGNIHLRNGHVPLLLDLGAVVMMSQVGNSSQVVTAGYSPPEQYVRRGRIGPWTDVYAIGASMRCCIEGKTPVPAPKRIQEETLEPIAETYRDRYPSYLLEAIDWCMQLDEAKRPQNAGELLDRFEREQDVLTPSELRGLRSPQYRPRGDGVI